MTSPPLRSPDLPSSPSVTGIPVQLLDECVRIEYAPGRSKLVAYPDFLTSLHAFSEEKGKLSSQDYMLPPNVMFMSVSGGSFKVMLYYPECIHPLEFTRDGTYDRLLPNVVVSIALVPGSEAGKWRVDLSLIRFFATHRTLEEFPRQFYDAPMENWLTTVPFTNIYSNGTMCFGGNGAIKEIVLPNLRPLASFYYTLFNSPFNTDLGVGSARGKTPEAWFKLLRDAATKRKADPTAKFPYHELSYLNASE